MTRHLLDKDGDHCRFPHWEVNGNGHTGRLNVCGKPGYPYCELHAEIVRLRHADRAGTLIYVAPARIPPRVTQ